jgi:hypothetical protein
MRKREYCLSCEEDITHGHSSCLKIPKERVSNFDGYICAECWEPSDGIVCKCKCKEKESVKVDIEKTDKLLNYLGELKGFSDVLAHEDIKVRIDKVCDAIEKELEIGCDPVGELKVKIDGSEVVEYVQKEIKKLERRAKRL